MGVRIHLRTWQLEALIVGAVLAGAAALSGPPVIAWREWLAAMAVLASFGHAQVADRLHEREAARPRPAVKCFRWLWRYYLAKEVVWIMYFVTTGSIAALAGCAVFCAYPVWRRWWRRRHPIRFERTEFVDVSSHPLPDVRRDRSDRHTGIT